MSAGALLMSYGSPSSLAREDVGTYLTRVRRGREPDDELLNEFTRRYRIIGGSPLIPLTRRLADALQEMLGLPVELGMRFSEPSIETGLRRLAADGVAEVAAIILSPQYSPLLMGGYAAGIAEAQAAMGGDALQVRTAGAWHEEPAFIDALAGRLREAMTDADPASTHVLLTAHSLPRHVAEQEPDYLEQLRVTAEAVATAAGLQPSTWTSCWQSAGHEPGEWMTPDFADLMPRLAAAGQRRVVVVPIQFLADHLETLYDVDIAAREQAEAHGLDFQRVRALNDDPALVAALAAVARRTLAVEVGRCPSPSGATADHPRRAY